MRMVTGTGNYVTVAARQIILKESSIRKLVVDIEITESRLFMQEGPDDLRTYRTLSHLCSPIVAVGLNCLKKEKFML